MRISLIIVSKDEPALGDTLEAVAGLREGSLDQVIVVDASSGRLDRIRAQHPWVEWFDYPPQPGRRLTIPHQRNVGVRAAIGDIVVFTDCGCLPRSQWLERLVAPILEEGEEVTCGPAVARGPNVYSGDRWWGATTARYVAAGATINMAFTRAAYEAVGGFDERFGAGEDLDFSWRLVDRGYRLRWVPDAVVEHEWGGIRRQLRRALAYGAGWARLYRKHPGRLRTAPSEHPVALVYPLFLLGLPLTLRYRAYPLLLLVPLWRGRKEQRPFLVVADHVLQGVGFLTEVVRGLR